MAILGVVSLVAVHPSTVNTLGKQLLPKTFGQSNVNIAQQVVRVLLKNLAHLSKRLYVGLFHVRYFKKSEFQLQILVYLQTLVRILSSSVVLRGSGIHK